MNHLKPFQRPSIALVLLGGALLLPLALSSADPPEPPHTPPTPKGLECLMAAYPQHLCGARGNTLTWCKGTTMVYDDGRTHANYNALLGHADLEAMMSTPYPRGRHYPTPAVNTDPGRLRHEPFFRTMYGNSPNVVDRGHMECFAPVCGEPPNGGKPRTDSVGRVAVHGPKERLMAQPPRIGARLAPVRWLTAYGGKTLHVTTINNVHRKLQAVSDELERSVSPQVLTAIAQTSGTFVWRTVKGTKRLSMHSFAIAIDIGVKAYGDFWKWSRPKGTTIPYRNRMPLEVVEIFERHGFIWGGKWYHYDTMHFEYRPELLVPGCATTPSQP